MALACYVCLDVMPLALEAVIKPLSVYAFHEVSPAPSNGRRCGSVSRPHGLGKSRSNNSLQFPVLTSPVACLQVPCWLSRRLTRDAESDTRVAIIPSRPKLYRSVAHFPTQFREQHKSRMYSRGERVDSGVFRRHPTVHRMVLQE